MWKRRADKPRKLPIIWNYGPGAPSLKRSNKTKAIEKKLKPRFFQQKKAVSVPLDHIPFQERIADLLAQCKELNVFMGASAQREKDMKEIMACLQSRYGTWKWWRASPRSSGG